MQNAHKLCNPVSILTQNGMQYVRFDGGDGDVYRVDERE